MSNLITSYITDLKNTIEKIPTEAIEEVIALLQEARLKGQQIFVMGNGGSATTASHFVCDLAKNTRKIGRPHFRVLGLTDNISIITAYANDEGYENVFAQQLDNFLQVGDVVIAISASGNSPNVVKAVELANRRGAKTIGFVGFNGGKLLKLCQTCVHIPSNHYGQVEDIHLMLEHIICDTIFKMPFPEENIPVSFGKSKISHPTRLENQAQFNSDTSLLSPEELNSSKSNELLLKISQELATKLDLEMLLPRILQLTVEFIGAASGSLVVLNESGDVVMGSLAYKGIIQKKQSTTLVDKVQHGLAGWVVENKQPVLVDSTQDDPRWTPGVWEGGNAGSRSAICVPLISQDRVAGVLTLTRMEKNRFTMEDLSLLTAITLALSCTVGGRIQSAKPTK